VKERTPFPFRPLYEKLGPAFGLQTDEVTLAARFDGVVQPLIADLRRELAAALGR
jgi:hypothetical protein